MSKIPHQAGLLAGSCGFNYGTIAPMALDIPRIKALCFDVDGTLSDTDDLYAQKIVDLLPRFLFRNPMQTARRLVMWVEAPGNALLGFADRIGIDDEMTALIDWMNRHRTNPKRKFLLVPGVDEMLAQIHGRYPMAVVSARDEKSTLWFLDRFDLCKYFDVVITGLSAPHTKPYPDPILLAAQKMGVKPEECLMIGDTTVDIRAGKAAGAQALGVLCGFGEEDELKQLGANLIIKSTSELTEVLDGNMITPTLIGTQTLAPNAHLPRVQMPGEGSENAERADFKEDLHRSAS